MDGETAIEMETKITTKNDKLFFENLDGKLVSKQINIDYLPLKTHLELNDFEKMINYNNLGIVLLRNDKFTNYIN